jgi:hypothetical protein
MKDSSTEAVTVEGVNGSSDSNAIAYVAIGIGIAWTAYHAKRYYERRGERQARKALKKEQ